MISMYILIITHWYPKKSQLSSYRRNVTNKQTNIDPVQVPETVGVIVSKLFDSVGHAIL